MDAWEVLLAHSTAGDAWERLNSIEGSSSTIVHAYEAHQFDIVEAGSTFVVNGDLLTFDMTESETIQFGSAQEAITFIESDVIEVRND